jgi:acetyl-CoA carboxylase biotin carboxyl carrier protein
MSLSHEDVVRIIQILDASHFDELSLETDGVKLNLRRNGAGEPAAQGSQGTIPTHASSIQASEKPAAKVGAPVAVKASPVGEAGLVDVRAPMLGVYYGAPKPGAAPFVTVGSSVDKDTAIGIIEVMKLMNSVSARVKGVVVETLVNDGEMVEYDQVLVRVRPA